MHFERIDRRNKSFEAVERVYLRASVIWFKMIVAALLFTYSIIRSIKILIQSLLLRKHIKERKFSFEVKNSVANVLMMTYRRDLIFVTHMKFDFVSGEEKRDNHCTFESMHDCMCMCVIILLVCKVNNGDLTHEGQVDHPSLSLFNNQTFIQSPYHFSILPLIHYQQWW